MALGRRSCCGARAAILAVALAVVLAAFPAVPRAGDATTVLSADAIGRYGPAGGMLQAGVARRWSRDDGPSALERGRYVQLGVSAGANPAYAQGSVAAEWVPVAALQLRLQYDAYGFFGANGALLRLPSKDARFGPRELHALAGEEEDGIGQRVLFNPVVRARLGRALLVSQTDLAWYALSRRPGWYHELEYDTLLRRRDWLVANRTALLAEMGGAPGGATFLLGPTYDVTRAGAAGIIRQRVGVALSCDPPGRWLGLDRLRVYALAGAIVSDRNRQGTPFAVLGVGGDLELGAGR